MEVNNSKIRPIAFLASCLMVTSTIFGCAMVQQPEVATPTPSSPVASASPTAPANITGIQQWASILKGESLHGLTFTTDGRLLYQDKVLLTEIPVSFVSDGSVTYAQQLIVSDPSPSNRFNIIKACEGTTDESGLCWAVFLIDRQLETAEKIGIAKYGGQNWVEWSADERYAVFAESMEGVSWFVVLDLQTKDSEMFEQTSATADLNSFTWIDDRTFQVDVVCGDQADCTESPFRGNISTLFSE